jgi:thiamine kinase-like enzyme
MRAGQSRYVVGAGELTEPLALAGRLLSRQDRDPVRAIRRPMKAGSGAIHLAQVDLVFEGDLTIEVVEKCVRATSNEAAFWRTARDRHVEVGGESYTCLVPTQALTRGSMSFLYFPYVEELDQERPVLHALFEAEIEQIVSALAMFNGRNLTDNRTIYGNGRLPFRGMVKRPSTRELQAALRINVNNARLLKQVWSEVRRQWKVVWDRYQGLSQCLCHNDISPGNTIHLRGTTTFVDFGLASVGPVGSDLHTVIRWCNDAMVSPKRTRELLDLYVEGLRSCGVEITTQDVELALWVTFYMRYSDISKRSARDSGAFSLAHYQMKKLLEGYTDFAWEDLA